MAQKEILQSIKEDLTKRTITLEEALGLKLLLETKITNEGQIPYNYGRVIYPELEAILARLINIINTNEIEPLETAVEQILNSGKKISLS